MDFSSYLQFLIADDAQSAEVYIPLDLQAESWHTVRLPSGNSTYKKQVERLEVVTGLRHTLQASALNHKHVLLVGKPGSGKSTALRRFRQDLAGKALHHPQAPIPVLITLRENLPLLDAITAEFQRAGCAITAEQRDHLLQENRLVLLLDGLDESHLERYEREIWQLRDRHPRTWMVFTARDRVTGLDIIPHVELCNLNEAQIAAWVSTYAPDHAEEWLPALLQYPWSWVETPLQLSLLCEVWHLTEGQIRPAQPLSPTAVLQALDQQWSTWTPALGAAIGENIAAPLWQWTGELLRDLATSLMQADQHPAHPAWHLDQAQVQSLIDRFLQQQGIAGDDLSPAGLQALRHHPALRVVPQYPNTIEFRHALLQNYYAAAFLLRELPQISDSTLKQNYLNQLKWTEPLAMLLAILDDQAQALRIVRLAFEVDWLLAARLAGAVKPEWQSAALSPLESLEMPMLLRCQCWAASQSLAVMPQLLQALEANNSDIRVRAAEALGRLGRAEVLPGLLPALGHSSYFVRASAVEALGRLGRAEVLPGLRQALADEKDYVQERAVEACCRMGRLDLLPGAAPGGDLTSAGQPTETIPELRPVLEQAKAPERIKAVRRLGQIGGLAALPQLLTALADRNPRVFECAAEVLGQLGLVEAIPGLLQALEQPNPLLRQRVVEALATLGHPEAIPGLLQALDDPAAQVCQRAMAGLERLGYRAALPQMAQIFVTHPDPQTRVQAAGILTRWGYGEAKPLFLQALSDPHPSVRESAIRGLGAVGGDDSVPSLLNALGDRSSGVRQQAVRTLGIRHCIEAVPELLKLQSDAEVAVRQSVVTALEDLGSQAGLPGLLRALSDENASVRRAAIAALGRLGSPEAMPRLLSMLNDHDATVAVGAAQVLGQWGRADGIPRLLRALDMDEWPHGDIRAEAGLALRVMGFEAAIPGLLKALEYSDYFVRESVAMAMATIGAAAIPPLVSALQRSDAAVRSGAALVLGRLGDGAAVPGLLSLLADEKSYVQESAATALGRLGSSLVLPRLWRQILSVEDEDRYSISTLLGRLYEAILMVQSRCGVYAPEVI